MTAGDMLMWEQRLSRRLPVSLEAPAGVAVPGKRCWTVPSGCRCPVRGQSGTFVALAFHLQFKSTYVPTTTLAEENGSSHFWDVSGPETRVHMGPGREAVTSGVG